jgi:hypothetical protein
MKNKIKKIICLLLFISMFIIWHYVGLFGIFVIAFEFAIILAIIKSIKE